MPQDTTSICSWGYLIFSKNLWNMHYSLISFGNSQGKLKSGGIKGHVDVESQEWSLQPMVLI